MHRFRKRSDAKRGPFPVHQSSSSLQSSESPLDLPPASDFRTSLILPDLSRRFSLLRNSSGEPLSLESLRNRLAEQRARREENHILEEEEDMILETLSRIRHKNASTAPSTSTTDWDTSPHTSYSAHSGTNSVTSSPGGRSTRRYSNNLFGSSRHKETSYIRSVAKSQQRKASTTPSEVSIAASSLSPKYPDSRPGSARAATPDESSGIDATDISDHVPKSAPLTFPAPYGQTEETFSSGPSANGQKRVSLALENAIKELEEEEEEDERIVMPRSPPTSQIALEQGLPPIDTTIPEPDTLSGMAISPDTAEFQFDKGRASPIPARTLPGYVPGMPRPMTPHTDSESRPSTPRAMTPSSMASPHTSYLSSSTNARPEPAAISPSFHRSMSPSPMFLHRSPSAGRRTPDNLPDRSSTASPSIESRLNRRPASPLANAAFQPMALPDQPNTPSKMGWGKQVHSRSGSWVSEVADPLADNANAVAKSPRSLKSPPLPDSPIDRGHVPSYSVTSDISDQMAKTPPPRTSPLPVDNQTTPTGTPAPSVPMHSVQPSSSFTVDTRHSSYQSSLGGSPWAQNTFNPFVFSPIPNSSRSSLESTGSSYHSESGDTKDPVNALFDSGSSQQTSWHDLSILEHSPSNMSSLNDSQATEVISRYGLKPSDFFAIQDKLVSVAIAKLSAPESLERVGSLRRRRPSTSHSINGRDVSRIASPPPRNASPGPNADMLSRATALLNSVVENSRPPPTSQAPMAPDIQPAGPTTPTKRDVSPNTRRNRDLAQMLFGSQEVQDSANDQHTYGPAPGDEPAVDSSGGSAPLYPTSPHVLHSDIAPHGASAAELERQVMYKNNAAMLALRKRPSHSNFSEGLSSSGSMRKKITPQQISTPTLVSASASVDTIPLPANSPPSSTSSGPSRFGSKLKRLRGTLRAKPNAPQNEATTPGSPPATQLAVYDPSRLYPVGEQPLMSATEPTRSRVTVPSPPASAGPGLKGFMSRFRGNKRSTENALGEEGYSVHHNNPSPIASPRSAHMLQGSPGSPPITPREPGYAMPLTPTALRHEANPMDELDQQDSQAGKIQHLFDVASDLGLDQKALNDLVRSASTSTKATRWSQATGFDRLASTSSPMEEEPVDPALTTPRTPLTKSLSIRKSRARSRTGREAQNSDGTSVVLRRTLIFPSDSRISTPDGFASVKRSASQRKRTSGQSQSGRSVLDRVPTPPPPQSSSDHFTGASPPVPQLPSSFSGSPESAVRLAPPSSNSMYDSLYDTYTTEPRQSTDNYPKSLNEPGSALEVIELANGETIWSIVNGLRDDGESIGGSRRSFTSEYSYDDMQVFVKEHGRTNSKGSNASFNSQPRRTDVNRPETKVFYSSPGHIGKLIENLSQGMEAGSFNIMPHRQNHSVASSLSSTADWTVEDRLEHMLGTLNGR